MSTQEILAELPRLSNEDLKRIAVVLNALEAERHTGSAPAGPEPLIEAGHVADSPSKPTLTLHAAKPQPFAPDPLRTRSELIATLLYDPVEPASEDEWPAESL